MENYQVLFPCSSRNREAYSPLTTDKESVYPENSGGFSGFGVGDPAKASSDQSGSSSFGSEENGEKATKKKGEKKIRRAKHAFQTRSQVDILDDGYRWRKYGQKAVKNNKYPRSYYRCSHQGCNVKKQVQRLTKDEGVVVTTYEGVHSHPIDKPSDTFEHILSQMQMYTSYV